MATVRAGAARAVDVCVSLLLGGMAGLVGAFVHPAVLRFGGIAWPVGLLVALALELVALRLAIGVAGRAGAWLAGLAWVGVVLALTWPRGAGDVVVPATWYGYGFLVLGLGTAMVVATVAQARSVVATAGSASAADPDGR